MNNSVVYFTLRPSIYAAWFENALIILDSETDSYLSLIDDAAQHFSLVIEHSFIQNSDGTYGTASLAHDPELFNFWINHFLEQKFILPSSTKNKRSLGFPRKPGGLCNYQWDTKPSWNPLHQVSIWRLTKAFIMLTRVHGVMKRKGMQGLLQLIDTYAKRHQLLRQPTEQEVENIAAMVDGASVLYPKKTFCLAWAATYVCISLKQGKAAHLVIGIQTNPFYAHAWAEANKAVVHDDPEIANVLSIILRTPLPQD